MSADPNHCIPASLAYAETRAAAHQLRAMAARLLAISELLPLPPDDELAVLLETATARSLERMPILGLSIDLDAIVRGALLTAADDLDEAASREP